MTPTRSNVAVANAVRKSAVYSVEDMKNDVHCHLDFPKARKAHSFAGAILNKSGQCGMETFNPDSCMEE